MCRDVDGSVMIIGEMSGKSEDTFGYVLTRKGQYSFCFENPSYQEKVVTFAINVIRRVS